MNYRIVPLYLISMVVILTIIGVIMSLDEAKYTPAAIALFILFGVLSVLLLLSVPFVRKKEIAIEMESYDFNKIENENRSIYDYSNEDEELSLFFDSSGMTLNDAFYWYNHLRICINTSNYLNKVLISIIFYIDEYNYCQIPFDGESINMVKKFNIKLENLEVFEYIIKHKEDAFNQIYKTSRVLLK
jgi:hypothetical protein